MRAAALAILSLCGMAMAGPSAPGLRDLIWTDPAADRGYVLTHPPRECLKRTDAEIETGRALFRSRTLLGGPAARVGLSCESCHANGRANPHFLLPELTNVAGAADVTSEWASKVRGDGVMNPKPIPDLAGAGSRASFGSNKDPSLEHFVRSVIEEEFQGPPPPDGALRALLAYVRALDKDSCPAAPGALTIKTLTDDVRRAAAAAGAQAADGDAATADLTVLAAQDSIARLVERLPEQRFGRDRFDLERLARDLGAARYQTPLPATLPPMLRAWNGRFDRVARRLEGQDGRTFANAERLRAALEAAAAAK